MESCSNITAGLIAINCATAPIGGTGASVYLFNYSEIDREKSTVADRVITGIALKSGSMKGYVFQSTGKTNTGEFSYNKTTYFGNWQQDLTLRVLAKSEAAKTFVNRANGANIVAIVENRESGPDGEVRYEAYGWDAGLELLECTGTTDMADGVVYTLKFGSGSTSKEGTIPKSVFIIPEGEGPATLAATEAALASLVA
jgi:hypothetical protein